MDRDAVDRIIDTHGTDPGSLIRVLLDVQEKRQWLSQEALDRVAERLGLPVSKVQHVATFYKAFSVSPSNEHRVHVCDGTSCHLRGSQRLIDAVKEIADSDEAFGKMDLEAVTCMGCCGSGPNMEIDGKPHAGLTAEGAVDLVKKLN